MEFTETGMQYYTCKSRYGIYSVFKHEKTKNTLAVVLLQCLFVTVTKSIFL